MEANELMIGDWVKYNNTACKVYCIDSLLERKDEKYNNKFVITLLCSGFINVTEDEIEPIPLTEEIMDANEFSFKAVDMYMGHLWCSGVIWTHENMTQQQEVDFNSVFSVLLPQGTISIKFVHELQHALRLCGMNELADNFKIE